jgi:hypothetical protein
MEDKPMDEYAVQLEGIAGRVSVVPGSFLKGATLRVEGTAAAKKRGRYLLTRLDGSTVEAKLVGHLTRIVPDVEIDGKRYRVGPAIPTWLVILSALPFGLVGIGGALGGGIGGLAWVVNQQIARSSLSAVAKPAAMIGVTLAAFASYLVLAGALFMTVNE